MPVLRRVGGVALVLLLLVAFTPLVNVWAYWLAPSAPAPGGGPVQAIVVLGAGGVTAAGVLTDASLRGAFRGISLYRRGIAPVVIFSGSRAEGTRDEASARADLARDCGVPASAIITSATARTTREEALHVRALLASRGPARALPAALMTIGLAALLVSTMPGLPGAGAPAARDLREQVFTSPTAAPTGNARTGGESVGAPDTAKSPSGPSGAPQLAPPAVTDGRTNGAAGSGSTPAPADQGAAPIPQATSSPAPVVPAPADQSANPVALQGPSPLHVVAFASLLAGLFLLILRRAGPRATA